MLYWFFILVLLQRYGDYAGEGILPLPSYHPANIAEQKIKSGQIDPKTRLDYDYLAKLNKTDNYIAD